MRFGSPKPGRSDTLTATMDKHPFCVGEPDADTYCVNLRGSFIGSPEPGVAETMVASQSKFPPVVGFDSRRDVSAYPEISLDSVSATTRLLAKHLRALGVGGTKGRECVYEDKMPTLRARGDGFVVECSHA